MRKRFRRKLLFALALVVVIMAALGLYPVFGPSFQRSPFPLPDSPMVVFRLGGRVSPLDPAQQSKPTLHGFLIEEQHVVNDPQLQQSAGEILDSRFTYGVDGFLCFEPGFAIRFGNGPNQVDALICLECRHVYFYREPDLHTRSLNKLGDARLARLYARLFPAAAARDADR